MQFNKITLQFLRNDYIKIANSLPIPTFRREISKHNHQGFIVITYEIKHPITSIKQLQWIANIKQYMEHTIKVNFEFIEFYDSKNMNYSNIKYEIKELQEQFNSFKIKYPKMMYAGNKEEIYRNLCRYAKRLYEYRLLSIEILVAGAMKMNNTLKKPYKQRELLKKCYGAYKLILENKSDIRQVLNKEELSKAYSRGGKMSAKNKKAKNLKRIKEVIETMKYFKANGNLNITAIGKDTHLSRPTATKLSNEYESAYFLTLVIYLATMKEIGIYFNLSIFQNLLNKNLGAK